MQDWSTFDFPTVGVIDAPTPFVAPSRPEAPVLASGTVSSVIESPPHAASWIPADVPVTRETLLNALVLGEEERRYIWSIDQREPAWHRARAGRLTGSRVGSAAGHNPYCSPEKLVHEWLYVPVVDNATMKHGRDNEDPARDLYCNVKRKQNRPYKQCIEFSPPPSYLDADFAHIDDVAPLDPNTVSDAPYDIRVDVRGLVVHSTKPYFGYSSDGEVFETDDQGLLEIKCPRRMYKEIPWYYYDQIQFGMYNLGLEWCDFWVWTAQQTSLHRYAFNRDYWEHDLLPKLESFYQDLFIPAAIEAIERERAWTPQTAKRTRSFHL